MRICEAYGISAVSADGVVGGGGGVGGCYLREAAQHQAHQPADIRERGLCTGAADVCAAGVLRGSHRHARQRRVLAHAQQQGVQTLPQLHGLRDGRTKHNNTDLHVQ